MGNAKVGPNTIIQTVEALKEFYGENRAREMLQEGQHSHLIHTMPAEMVEEQEFLTLVQMLQDHVGSEETRKLLKRSGQLTARYLLKHRIPGPFQRLVKVLPREWGLTLLLMAISGNAWTFVGSGTFSFMGGKEARIIIANRSPEQAVQPEVCSFYAGTFEALFQTLIHAQCLVQEMVIRGGDVAPNVSHGDDIRCAYKIVFA